MKKTTASRTSTEVTFGVTETRAHVYSDGTLGDVYRFAADVEELASYAPDSEKYLREWPLGRNPLFRHYTGPNRAGFLRSAHAELKRNPNA